MPTSPLDRIEHIVVLMPENRPFGEPFAHSTPHGEQASQDAVSAGAEKSVSFLAGWWSWFRPFAHNAHRDSGYPPHDFRLRRVVEHPHFAMRMRMGNHDQPAAIDFAPAAQVAVP